MKLIREFLAPNAHPTFSSSRGVSRLYHETFDVSMAEMCNNSQHRISPAAYKLGRGYRAGTGTQNLRLKEPVTV